MAKLLYVVQDAVGNEVLSVTSSFGKAIANLRELLIDYVPCDHYRLSCWDGFDNEEFCEVKLHPEAFFNSRGLNKQVNKKTIEEALTQSSTILVI